MVAESQREIESRKKARETRKTANAPERAAEYDMAAPVHGPNVYPDKVISVEYKGRGATEGLGMSGKAVAGF